GRRHRAAPTAAGPHPPTNEPLGTTVAPHRQAADRASAAISALRRPPHGCATARPLLADRVPHPAPGGRGTGTIPPRPPSASKRRAPPARAAPRTRSTLSLRHRRPFLSPTRAIVESSRQRR